jgi:hypothetical protein
MSVAGLIINQKSSRSPSIMDDLLYVAKRFPGVRSIVLDGIEGLDRTLAELNRAKIDTLIVAGGDGTLQAAFTDSINMRRFEYSPDVVAVPCGMTNVIAADCGLQGAPGGSLDSFLWRRKRGDVRRVTRPLMGVRFGENSPAIYGFFLGAGAFHSAVKFSRNTVQTSGAKRSLALALSIGGYIAKAVFGEKPSEPPLLADMHSGDSAPYEGERELTIAMMTTLRRLVLGIYPFWGEGDDPLAITTIDFPSRKLLRAAPIVLRGRSAPWFSREGYQSWRTSGLEIGFEGPFVFDGEIYHVEPNQRMTIETTHNAGFLL